MADENKDQQEQLESGLKGPIHTDAEIKHGDKALALIGDERVELTAEDSVRIKRKTDVHILSMLMWVYFLQIFDKTLYGNGKILGMVQSNQLKGDEYSVSSSMNAIAQLAWQPFSAYVLVRIPSRYLMAMMVFGWGAAQTCMAASHSFGGLVTSRFFLGLFEAGCLPLFSILVSQWYRRSEQPIRVALYYGTNGVATIVAALISFGFAHVPNPKLEPWQAIFLLSGLLTVLTVPFILWLVDSDVASARFFNHEDKAKAIERLRGNQTGTGTNEFKWRQVIEVFIDVKTYLYFSMVLCVNVGAAVTTYFGPTLINNFGFSPEISSLLNMPFGALQVIVILLGCYAAQKAKVKSAVVAFLVMPVIVGLGLLYKQGNQGYFKQSEALAGYYLLAFLYGCNPVLVSWMVANTAGQTKKAVIMSTFNAASAVGNIVGPLLFEAKDKPFYLPGVRAALGLFCSVIAAVGLQVAAVYFFNKQRSRQRVTNGKPAVIQDTSMETRYQAYGQEEVHLGQNAWLDLTDFKNDEFTYVY